MKKNIKDIATICVVLSAIWIIIVTLIAFLLLFFGFYNHAVKDVCEEYSIKEKVILDKSGIIDKCLIVKDGEELTVKKYIDMHKSNLMEIRE